MDLHYVLIEQLRVTRRVEDRRDGSYAASYVVNDAGRYQLSVQCLKSGNALQGSPWAVLVAPGPTYAPTSYLKGRDLGRAVAGEPCAFELIARDSRGNRQERTRDSNPAPCCCY